jgi:hypothetical protein
LRALGFGNLRIVGQEVGRASAIKMIRSVMVKGVEALTAEMMLGAEAAGVVEEVLASLDASERPRPWAEKAAYNIERMVTHGAPRRRNGRIRQNAGKPRRGPADDARHRGAPARDGRAQERLIVMSPIGEKPHDYRLSRPLHRAATRA